MDLNVSVDNNEIVNTNALPPKKFSRNEVELTADIAVEKVRVGGFWSPEPMDILSKVILTDIEFFYTPERIINYLLPLVTQQSEVSGRTLDWLVTNFSKKNPIMYRWKVYENRDPEAINIHIKYGEWLTDHKRRGFDAFRRNQRLYFERPKLHEFHDNLLSHFPIMNNSSSTSSISTIRLVYTTTVAQLNFFYFAWIYGIYSYALKNNALILEDMKHTMSTVQVEVDQDGKRCRRQLSKAPSIKCSVFKMDILQSTNLEIDSSSSNSNSSSIFPFSYLMKSGQENQTLSLVHPATTPTFVSHKRKKDPDISLTHLPKRPRGRPRKYPSVEETTPIIPVTTTIKLAVSQDTTTTATTVARQPKVLQDLNLPKRKRGRPRKVLTPEQEAMKMEKQTQDDDDPYKAMGLENPNQTTLKKKKPQRQRVKTFASGPKPSSASVAKQQLQSSDKFLEQDDNAMLQWFVQ